MQKKELIINEGFKSLKKSRLCNWTFVIVFLLIGINTYAQSGPGTVTGMVTDEGGMSLPGVSVLAKGSSNGTSTDFDGNYSLQVDDIDTNILVFSFVGMQTIEESINGRQSINVILKADAQSLDEVIVVGYGTQKKSDITGAVASVPNERLTDLPNVNFTESLQGAVAGVSVSLSSAGAEGGDLNILIRGRNSITADNNPLIVLDGIPYIGNYSDISPATINSIEVLKDASATAIYGSRGANGVIIITSKKGRKGKTRMEYSGSYGISEIANLPSIMNGQQYYDFKNTADSSLLTDSERAVYAENPKGTDWIDLATRVGSQSIHNLAFSGGSELTTFYVSANYMDVEGVALNDNFTRYALRTNIETKVTDWLKLGTNSQISYSDRSGIAASFEQASYMNPLTTAFNEDGSLTLNPWPEDVFFGNPLQATLAKDDDNSYGVITNNYLEINFPFIEGLSYKLNTGININHSDRGYYYGRDTNWGYDNQGVAYTKNAKQTTVLVENIVSYNRSFDKHNISLTGLYSYQEDESESRELLGKGFDSDELTWYQMNIANSLSPETQYFKKDLLSTMFRANYNYDGKYMATFTIRRDGYSAFGVDNKYGVFPSFSLAWNITKESFLADNDVVNNLKLRVSYGQNGNQAVDPYTTLSKVSSSYYDPEEEVFQSYSYVNGQTTLPGFFPNTLGTPTLGWETTTSTNIGVDFGFIKNRINGSVDAYISNTDDLLLNRSISSTHGISSIVQNIGSVKNTGIELNLTGYIISKSDLSWDATFTGSYNKNEIVSLTGDGGDDVNNKWFIGKPITVNYRYQFDGIIQTQQEADDWLNYNDQAAPGFAKVKDINNDGKIDAEDRVVQGQRDPKYIYGFSTRLKYKNFTFSAFLQGASGAIKSNTFRSDDTWVLRRNTTYKNWWTPENGSNVWAANRTTPNPNPYGTGMLESADFLRLKDISLKYNFPSTLNKKIGLQNFSIYITGRNLVTFTDWFGMDPELSTQRAIPLQKQITFGLNLEL